MPQLPQPAIKTTAVPQQRQLPPKPPYTGLFQEPALPARSVEWDEDDEPETQG